MEFGLLAVTIMIVLGLVLAGPAEALPVEEHPIGAAEPGGKAEQTKAS